MELDITSIIEKQVKQEIADIDMGYIIKSQIRDIIANGVGKEIVATIAATAKDMIAEEVRKALDGEVKTDDGWGKHQSYPSFEGLFKTTFRKAMEEKYEVKREIEKQVAARVQSLVKQDYNKVIEKIVNEISGTKLCEK